jgi:hypothetical protein
MLLHQQPDEELRQYESPEIVVRFVRPDDDNSKMRSRTIPWASAFRLGTIPLHQRTRNTRTKSLNRFQST